MKNRTIIFALLAGLMIQAASAYTTNDINGILAEFPAGTVHQHQMIPMRDGIRLSTYCFLPAGHAVTNYPVVLVRSAYNDWSQRKTYANDVVDRTDTNNLKWINTNGYVYVFQDLRGDGESETNANFEPRLSENEINDTYDTVEALATNAWSNGRVGMYGSSGHGMAAYMGWLSRAPHLVVANPGNTGPNLYEHWSFENGVRRWIYQWLSFRNSKGTAMPVWPKPTPGDYYTNSQWRQTLREGALNNSTILMASDAWHNYFLDNTFDTFTALNSGHKAFMTMDHGTHQGDIGLTFTPKPSGFLNIPTVFQILDGVPFTNAPTLKYFVMGDARRAAPEGNFYRLASSWPPSAVTVPYYFHADGTLSSVMPASGTNALSYSYHPTNPVPTVGGNFSYGYGNPSGPLDQLVPQLTNRTDILRFETAPFTNTVEITGRLQARLYISSDVSDTTFMVKLIDVYPAEGTNTEYYAIMRESAVMARFWSGLTSPSPLTTGQVYRLDVDMSSIALMIETNHRVAVHITSSSDPAFEVHPNTYNQVMDFSNSPTAHNTLYLNSQYPSMIRLPLYNTEVPSVLLSTNCIQVTEGGTAQFQVQLNSAVSSAVTVTVERMSGDPDMNVSSGAALVFTPENWSVPQTVTLSADQDADGADGATEIEVSGSGVASVLLTADETDDDPFIVPASSGLDVPEGGAASAGFALSRAPVSAVTVTVSRISGDTDLSVNGVSNFVFTSGNWSTTQMVSFAAAEDADTLWNTALFRFSSDRAFSADVTVREQDNDRSPLRVDFGLTGSQVEADGGWLEFPKDSTASGSSTGRVFNMNGSNVTVTLSSGGVFSGRDRANPSADSGARTYSSMYRDLIQSSSGAITVTVSGVKSSQEYAVRLWIYDYNNASGAMFTNRDITAGQNIVLGVITNMISGSGVLPTNNTMFSVAASVTSDVSGKIVWLIQNSGAQAARINGLEIDEIIPPVQNWTLAVGVNNPLWGSVSPTGGLFTAGSNVQVTATASNYYHFAEWTGDVTGVSATVEVPMTTNKILTAVFAETLVTNGTPQWWLAQHGLGTNDVDALSDTDGDGLAAWQEYIAGTLPNLGTSVFEISNHRETPDGSVLVWPVVMGRIYSVYWSSNLISGVWSQLAENVNGGYTDTVHGAQDQGFYQIKATYPGAN